MLGKYTTGFVGILFVGTLLSNDDDKVISEEPIETNTVIVSELALVGFDNKTNGLTTQKQFDSDKKQFENRETVETGLGPVYNADSCVACHSNPVTGGSSQVTEIRAGHFDIASSTFFPHPGGSLIQDRAIHPDIQKRVFADQEVRSLRSSLTLLGLGYVECIDNETLEKINRLQPIELRGQLVVVPVTEAPGRTRIGRFGWKCQHASLIAFGVEAYIDEMGITSPLRPAENSSNGRSVGDYDNVSDPEDKPGEEGFGEDVEQFVRFVRATKAPSRDEKIAKTAECIQGNKIFNQIGCHICHTPKIVTAEPGILINGGKYKIPKALGYKIIFPFSDFALHDVDTGDGIVQNGPQSTRLKMRTPPLWGLRTKTRLMHDFATVTRTEAILKHGGEAIPIINNFKALSVEDKRALLLFLQSL